MRTTFSAPLAAAPIAAALLTLAATFSAAAQSHADSARIDGAVLLHRSETLEWMTRDQGAIDRYAEENISLADRSCDVLFVGSSSVNMWHTIVEDMQPMKIIRRSYGGSTIRDMIYHYDVIARGYDPKAIVMLVNNDITGDGAHDLSVGEAFDWFRVFAGMIRRDYPSTPLVVIPVTPSHVRLAVVDKHRRLNYLLEEYAARTPFVEYVDLTAPMYDAAGKLRDDIFLPDRLHVNPAGYAEWTKILRPALMKLVGKD